MSYRPLCVDICTERAQRFNSSAHVVSGSVLFWVFWSVRSALPKRSCYRAWLVSHRSRRRCPCSFSACHMSRSTSSQRLAFLDMEADSHTSDRSTMCINVWSGGGSQCSLGAGAILRIMPSRCGTNGFFDHKDRRLADADPALRFGTPSGACPWISSRRHVSGSRQRPPVTFCICAPTGIVCLAFQR